MSLQQPEYPHLFKSLFPSEPSFILFGSSSSVESYEASDSDFRPRTCLSSSSSSILRCILKNAGFSLDHNRRDARWTLYWGLTRKLPSIELSPFQRIARFPSTFDLGRKDRLASNLSRATDQFGQAHFGFFPLTFVLPRDSDQLNAEFDTNYSRLSPAEMGQVRFIHKPTNSSKGIGVKLLNVNEAIEIVRKPADLSNAPRKCIIQEYLANPLVVNGHKIDLRLYVAVTSTDPLRIYMFKEGLVRFATSAYSQLLKPQSKKLTETAQKDQAFSHLTNYSINKKQKTVWTDPGKEYLMPARPVIFDLVQDQVVTIPPEGMRTYVNQLSTSTQSPHNSSHNPNDCIVIGDLDTDGTKWTLSQLLLYIYFILRADPLVVLHRIHDVLIKAVLSALPSLRDGAATLPFTTPSSSFELFGADILLDSSLRPHLLEFNTSPSLQASSPLDKRVKHALIVDLFNLVGLPLIGAPENHTPKNSSSDPAGNLGSQTDRMAENSRTRERENCERELRKAQNAADGEKEESDTETSDSDEATDVQLRSKPTPLQFIPSLAPAEWGEGQRVIQVSETGELVQMVPQMISKPSPLPQPAPLSPLKSSPGRRKNGPVQIRTATTKQRSTASLGLLPDLPTISLASPPVSQSALSTTDSSQIKHGTSLSLPIFHSKLAEWEKEEEIKQQPVGRFVPSIQIELIEDESDKDLWRRPLARSTTLSNPRPASLLPSSPLRVLPVVESTRHNYSLSSPIRRRPMSLMSSQPSKLRLPFITLSRSPATHNLFEVLVGNDTNRVLEAFFGTSRDLVNVTNMAERDLNQPLTFTPTSSSPSLSTTDVLCLLSSESEYARRGRFTRLFPTPFNCGLYSGIENGQDWFTFLANEVEGAKKQKPTAKDGKKNRESASGVKTLPPTSVFPKPTRNDAVLWSWLRLRLLDEAGLCGEVEHQPHTPSRLSSSSLSFTSPAPISSPQTTHIKPSLFTLLLSLLHPSLSPSLPLSHPTLQTAIVHDRTLRAQCLDHLPPFLSSAFDESGLYASFPTDLLEHLQFLPSSDKNTNSCPSSPSSQCEDHFESESAPNPSPTPSVSSPQTTSLFTLFVKLPSLTSNPSFRFHSPTLSLFDYPSVSLFSDYDSVPSCLSSFHDFLSTISLPHSTHLPCLSGSVQPSKRRQSPHLIPLSSSSLLPLSPQRPPNSPSSIRSIESTGSLSSLSHTSFSRADSSPTFRSHNTRKINSQLDLSVLCLPDWSASFSTPSRLAPSFHPPPKRKKGKHLVSPVNAKGKTGTEKTVKQRHSHLSTPQIQSVTLYTFC